MYRIVLRPQTTYFLFGLESSAVLPPRLLLGYVEHSSTYAFLTWAVRLRIKTLPFGSMLVFSIE